MVKIMENKQYDVIVVGSGIAGLTSAAYLAKEKLNVLLIEKDSSFGGLLGAFNVDGHWLDKGARGIIDSGIISPMLKQLGLNIQFTENPIQMTFENDSMQFTSEESLNDYENLLVRMFPEEKENIHQIMLDVKKIMTHMDVLYGIENPLFLPKPYELNYVFKVLLPWMFKYMFHVPKAMKFMKPVDEYLRTKTQNQSLIDLITQHFFAKTPTFFALSYFTLYLQYTYPMGSTQSFIDQFIEFFKHYDVDLLKNTEVIKIHTDKKTVQTKDGSVFSYSQLLWAADTNKLYECFQVDEIKSNERRNIIQEKRDFFKSKIGADSILTVYMLCDKDPSYFSLKNGPHGFYTPKREGLSTATLDLIRNQDGSFITDKTELLKWIKQHLLYNTFEISIPSLRDASLSPIGKTGLIVSVLFDYQLTEHIITCGFYDEFKIFVKDEIVHILNNGLWNDLEKSVYKTIVSTPKTIYDRTYATQGSVTGWSFVNQPFPAEYQFLKVSQSVNTPIDSIKQAGQFTFNPAGVPVAVMTGKLAADAIIEQRKKK